MLFQQHTIGGESTQLPKKTKKVFRNRSKATVKIVFFN